jgi:hypothetical protein
MEDKCRMCDAPVDLTHGSFPCDCLAIRDSLLGPSAILCALGQCLPNGGQVRVGDILNTAEAIVTGRARRDRGGE